MKRKIIVHLFIFGLSLCSFFISSTTVRAAISIPIPAHGAYFGVWATDAQGIFGDDKVIALETLINKKIALKSYGITDAQMFGPLSGCTNCIMAGLKKIDTDFHAIPMIHLNTINRSLTEITTNTIHPNDKRANYQTKPDDMFRGYAQGLKAFGKPVLLRIFSEMNWNVSTGPIWYICGACKDPDTGAVRTPAMLIAAWRHVHDIFVAEGATNVKFMWIQNPHYSGYLPDTVPYKDLYPGNAYVDWVGWDVYNNRGFTPFYNIIKADYDTMLTIAPGKPMIVPEFNSKAGSDTTGAARATWFTDMLTTDLPTKFPNIKAIALFNVQSDPNILIQDPGGAAKVIPAFKTAIASSYYLPANSIAISPTPTPATRIPGDLTDAGDVPGDQVNIFDYSILKQDMGKTGAKGFIPSDIDKNGVVDIFDRNILMGNFPL